MRYTNDGRLDGSFAGDGVALAGHPTAYSFDLALQQNGKIVAFGHTLSSEGRPAAFALTRFLPTGKVDRSLGVRGVATADLGADDYAAAVAIQPDGNIVGAGTAGTTSATGALLGDLALARFLAGTCSVPALRGKTLSAARARLAAGNCRLARVRKALSRKAKRGRIASQSPRAGREISDWGPVNVVVSRGRGKGVR